MSLENKIDESQISNKIIYEKNKNILICGICKFIIQIPVQCSSCKNIYCKSCLFSYSMTNNTCPNKCKTVEIINPPLETITIFLKLEVKCNKCEELVPLLKYKFHIEKCMLKNQKVLCFNCGSEQDGSNLMYQNVHDFSFDHQFNKKNNFDGENVFNIQVTTSDFNGYIVKNKDSLFCTKEFDKASIFSQITVNGKSYLKVFCDNEWKFLAPHYDLGVLVIPWRISGPIILDMNKQMMISDEGRTKGFPLCMRITDKKLYFWKEVKEYQQCQVKVMFIE